MESCPGLAVCWAAGQEVGWPHFCPLCWGHSPLCLSVPVFGSFCTVPHAPPPPRGLGTTDQGAGGGLAHLGQDAGFSTGGCQDPEDREEQGEDGQDAIHLEKSEPR